MEALTILKNKGYVTYDTLKSIAGPCALAAYNFLLKSGLAVKVGRGLLVSVDITGLRLSDLKAAIDLCKGKGDCVFELLRNSASEADRVIKTLYRAGTIKIEGVDPTFIQLWLESGWPSEVPSEKVQGDVAKYFSFAGPKAVMLRPPWGVQSAVVKVE